MRPPDPQFHPELLPGFVGGLCDSSVGRRPPHQAFWNIEKSFLIPITTGTVSGRGPRLWCQVVLDSGLGCTLLADRVWTWASSPLRASVSSSVRCRSSLSCFRECSTCSNSRCTVGSCVNDAITFFSLFDILILQARLPWLREVVAFSRGHTACYRWFKG